MCQVVCVCVGGGTPCFATTDNKTTRKICDTLALPIFDDDGRAINLFSAIKLVKWGEHTVRANIKVLLECVCVGVYVCLWVWVCVVCVHVCLGVYVCCFCACLCGCGCLCGCVCV